MRLLPLLALAVAAPALAACTQNADAVRGRRRPHDHGELDRRRLRRLGHGGAGRQAELRHHQRRLAGHGVLPARRGRPADRRRGREHRPRPQPPARRQRARRHLHDRLQARHEGQGDPRRLHGHRLRRPPRGQRRRPAARRRGAGPNYAAYVRDQSDQLLARTGAVRRGLPGPATTRGPRALPGRAPALGADRDGRGVLRRPRPEDGRPRGRPRAGPEVDRLAPDGEGPVARARRQVRRPRRRRSAAPTPRTCSPTPGPSTAGSRR